MKIKVGQVWETVYGNIVQITRLDATRAYLDYLHTEPSHFGIDSGSVNTGYEEANTGFTLRKLLQDVEEPETKAETIARLQSNSANIYQYKPAPTKGRDALSYKVYVAANDDDTVTITTLNHPRVLTRSEVAELIERLAQAIK